jgi:nicotinamidase-related amidase
MALPAGEQVLWPDHCIENTPGAQLHPSLEIPFGATVVRKGTRRDMDSYSAFLENDHATPVGLDALLREAHVGEIMSRVSRRTTASSTPPSMPVRWAMRSPSSSPAAAA